MWPLKHLVSRRLRMMERYGTSLTPLSVHPNPTPLTLPAPLPGNEKDTPVTTKDTHTTTTISQADRVDGCYALAHVDNCLVVGTTDEVRAVKDFLGTKSKIKDLGDVSVFTSLLILRDRSRSTSKYLTVNLRDNSLKYMAGRMAAQY